MWAHFEWGVLGKFSLIKEGRIVREDLHNMTVYNT